MTITSEVLSGLSKVLETGTEDEVFKYIKERWDELPQKLRDHLAVGILIDAIDENARLNRDFEETRENFYTILEELGKENPSEESPQQLQ